MSKVVDERVVEMRFDNKQFESNVQTSMSTIEKLKQKLNFKGASKGLEEINTAAKKTDFSGMSNGVETVQAKFSAMQVVAMTALANITNSAINAGTRIVKALTIDPITTGFQEYETQINAVQTILANTQKEGTNVKDVNAALDELNTYADKTIYNFTEMTRNIGTFTAAGVKLDTSVNAIQGIANLAAVSGSTSQQASTAMYQLSQALAAGTVKLMDWNSVVNAGMGGQVFQDALRETSELLGTGAEAAIAANGSFRESLQTGWLTSEVLTETLKKFTTSGAIEKVAEYTGVSAEAVQAALDSAEAQYGEADAIKYASKALAEKSGKSAEEIEQTLQFAKTAEDAATKVKTFTQLWDVLKEAAQSGWSQTWRLLVGDFEEAKEFFTNLSIPLTDFINKISDARNKLLESALGQSFGELKKKLQDIVEPVKRTKDVIDKVTDSMVDLGNIVDEVILGKFGNGQVRFDALTKSGYNWCVVQNKVNEKLGCSYRYTEEQIAAQDKLIGQQKDLNKSTEAVTETTEESTEATRELTEEQKDRIKELAKLSDAELRAKGYTEDQIEAFRELKKISEKLGIPLDDLIDNLDKINGRWLLLNSIMNVGRAIGKVISSIGKAWRDIFDPINPEVLFDAFAAIHKFTASLILSDENAKKLTDTFRGLFAILNIITTIVGGGFRVALMLTSKLLSAFDLNILDLTANLGNAAVKFRDFIFDNEYINKAFEILATTIEKVAKAFKDLAEVFAGLPQVQTFVNEIKDAFNDIKNIDFSGIGKAILTGLKQGLHGDFSSMMETFMGIPQIQKIVDRIKEMFNNLRNIDFSGIGRDLIAGLRNGINSDAASVIETIIEVGSNILSSIKEVLGIHSPSTEMFEVGTNVISGLVNGIGNGISLVMETIGTVGSAIASKLGEVFTNLDWSKLFAAGVSIGMLAILKKFTDVLGTIASPLEGLGSVFEGTGKVLASSAKGIGKTIKSFSKVLKSFAFSIKAKALKNIAISLAILVGAIVVLSFVDVSKLWNAVAIIGALAVILGILVVATNKMASASATIGKNGAKIGGFKTGLIAMGAALLLLAATVKMVGNLKPEQAKQGFIGLAGLVVALGAVFAAYGLLVKGKSAQNIDKAGKMLLKMSVSLLIMVGVIKLISGMSEGDLNRGGAAIVAFVGIVALLVSITKLSGKGIDKLGGMLIKMSVSMLLMVAVMKLVAGMSDREIEKGATAILAFVGIIALLVAVTKIGRDKDLAKLGGTLLAISTSMLLMVGVIKLVSGLSPEEMVKGAAAILAFTGIVALLMYIVKIVGSDAPKIALTLTAMSISIAILAGVAVLLGLINLKDLVKGVTAVGILGAVMALMIHATKGASDCKGNLIVMSVAIGVMATAIAALSMIEGKKLAGATTALSMVMGMFTLMAKAAGTMKKSMSSLIVMTVAIGILAGILYLLSKLPIESTLNAAASLSMLLLSLSASMALVSKAGAFADTALVSIGAMMLVVAALATIIGTLAYLDVGSTIEIAASLSLLLLSLSASMTIIGMTAPFAETALTAIGVMTLVVAGLAVIIGSLAYLEVGSTLEIAASLSLLLISLSAACLILAPIGIIGPAALIGVGMLALLITAVAGIMVGLGALVTYFPQMEEFLNRGLPMLGQIGYGLGSFVGNIVAGFAEGALSSISQIGTELSNFMSNLQPFLDGASSIDESSVTGVKTLAEAILILTGANIIESIGSFLTGGSSLADFGNQLVPFGESMKAYANAVAGIDVEAINGSAKAAKALAKMAGEIPNSGGFVSLLAGDNNLDDFGKKLVPFGKGMKEYSEAVVGIDAEAITGSAKAAKALAKMADEIPNSGGLISIISGENNIDTFGKKMVPFGKSLKEYSTAVIGIDAEAITNSAKAAKAVVKMANEIPNSGGFMELLAGDNSLATFGAQMVPFGRSLSNYSVAVSGINVEAINSSVSGAKSLVKLINSMSGIDASGVGAFAQSLNTLGRVSIDGFVNAFANAKGRVTGSVTSMMNSLVVAITSQSGRVASAFNAMLTSAISAITSKQGMFGAAGTLLIVQLRTGILSGSASIVPAMNSLMTRMLTIIKGRQAMFMISGNQLMLGFANGLRAGSSGISVSIMLVLSRCVSAIRLYYNSFDQAGKYLGQGLVDGIKSKETAAYNAGYNLGQKAVQGEKDGQQSHSPSKLTKKAGRWLGEGLIIGMEQMGQAVYRSGKSMGKNAVESISGALDGISDISNREFDVAPSITPVVDLDELQNGSRSLSIGADLSSRLLSGPVNSLQQIVTDAQNEINASNNEVIRAINGLREDLNTLYNADDQEIALYVDSKKLASSIAKPMNRQLNILSKRGAY